MPWSIPQPIDIYNRAASAYVAQFPSFQPTAPNTVCGATARIIGMTGFDLYLYQGYVMGELFPDTSQDNLDRHAAIWGLTRIPPQAATGTIAWQVTANTTLPTGIILTDQFGNAYLTTSGGAITVGTATISITAASPGAQGNLANGAVLTPLSPVEDMATTATVSSTPGLSGGAPAETNDALRARVLARIRQRGRGGNAGDYQNWCEAASSQVAYVQTVPNYLGPGSVGVFVAGMGPSVIGSGLLATISAYLGTQYASGGVVPVTAYVTLYSATLVPLNATVHLIPDTTANRAAATAAFQNWVATDAAIGATMYLNRFNAALENAGGEFAHETTSPTSDWIGAAGTIAVAGTLSFV